MNFQYAILAFNPICGEIVTVFLHTTLFGFLRNMGKIVFDTMAVKMVKNGFIAEVYSGKYD